MVRHAHLDFWKKFFNCGKISKKTLKIGQKCQKEHILLHALLQKPQTAEKWKLMET